MRDWVDEVRARLARDGVSAPPRDVVDEVAQHIADVHRSALLQGRSDQEIEQLVDAELANLRQVVNAIVRRRTRDQLAIGSSSPRAFAGLSRDVFHACRLLISRRAYSSVVVLTLAIGIGACTAVFSLFNALLLAPLPYPDPARLVLLWETEAGNRNAPFIVAAPNYLDWTRDTRSFSALGIWETLTFNLAATSEPEQVQGLRASASLFRVLGVPPALGRVYTPDEDAPGNKVAVISDAIWQVHFAGDPHVVGKPIRLNGNIHEVIGVMPRGFDFPRAGTGGVGADRVDATGSRARSTFVLRGRAVARRSDLRAGPRRRRTRRRGAATHVPGELGRGRDGAAHGGVRGWERPPDSHRVVWRRWRSYC